MCFLFLQDGRVIEARDPRPRYQRIWCRRQAADLPVPQFKVLLLYSLLFGLLLLGFGALSLSLFFVVCMHVLG